VPPRTKVFAIEYAKAGNIEAARKKANLSKAQAEELLAHPLVEAYLDDLIADDAEVSLITREFLQTELIYTLQQVNGDVAVPMVTRDGSPASAKTFNAPAKISLLKEMRMFLDVSHPERRDKIEFLSRLDPTQEQEFSDPRELWSACVEYFEWVEQNPVYSIQVQNQAGKAQETRTPRPRVPTENSLCVFIGVRRDTWDTWSDNQDSEFFPVVEVARQYISETKLAGGMAETMNPGLVSRDLGLMDSHRHEVTGRDGAALRMISREMTPQEAAEEYAATLHQDDEHG
jgi:hypothetical protein